jgi:hypothetical protein
MSEPIGSVNDFGGFAVCCFIEYEQCKPQRVKTDGTCDTPPAYYWLGTGCAAIRDCACVGPDCGDGYATEDECTEDYDGCEFRIQRCGSINGVTCIPGHFCFEPTCTATSNGGLCVPVPTTCDAVLEEVCGCDGVTYDNDCELQKASMSMRAFGACP